MTFPKPDFSAAALNDAARHAAACYPNESCGLIVAGAYLPCENQSATPETAFTIDPAEIVRAGADLQAVIHSHPEGLARPSAADMRAQIDLGCSFGIIPCIGGVLEAPVWWGDYRLDEPLIGRQFIPGACDCYSLIRGYYWQTRQIHLPDFARDEDWWKDGGDMYRQNFATAGFKEVAREEVETGDVFLGMVRADVPNHGGVFLERGLFLHHLEGRLSRREPIGSWDKFITHCLRYGG